MSWGAQLLPVPQAGGSASARRSPLSHDHPCAVFISIDMFVKAALFYLAYLELRKLGADYRSALSTPTSVSSGGSIAVTAGGESASSYQKFQSGAVSGAHMGGAAAESLDSDVYKSAAAGYNAPGAAAGVYTCAGGGSHIVRQPSCTDADAVLMRMLIYRTVCAAVHGLSITLCAPSRLQMHRPTADRTSRRRASTESAASLASLVMQRWRRDTFEAGVGLDSVVCKRSITHAYQGQRRVLQYWRDLQRPTSAAGGPGCLNVLPCNCDRDAESS